jgi:two-component system response regulator (stage 0 sporulation protein A)
VEKIKVVILTAFGQESMTREAVRLGAVYYFVKPLKMDVFIQRLLNIVNMDKDEDVPFSPPMEEIEAEADRIIAKLKIPPSYKGHAYLREAVLMATVDASCITEITKKLYPKIAEKFKTKDGRVERAMRFAIEKAWDRGKVDFLYGFFGYGVDERKGKPTNASLIAKIAGQVRRELMTRKLNEKSVGV